MAFYYLADLLDPLFFGFIDRFRHWYGNR